MAAVGFFLVHSYRSYAKLVDARLERGYLSSGAGIYAAPRTLRAGQKFSRATLKDALARAGYVESNETTEVWNGSFSVSENSIELRSNKGFPSVVTVTFDRDERIAGLAGDGLSLDSFTLEPEPLTDDSAMKNGAHGSVTFKEIPPVLVHAITSIEDRRFFDHHGLDIFGVTRALLRNAGDERIGQGGSTITQQLVKNTYLTPERTLRRKYAEAMLAFTIERRLSKEDIFALYCNEIYLGQRGVVAVRGVAQAARIYFGKDVKDLTVGEAATIAGMIQGPSRYSPVRHNDVAVARRNTVLGTMVRDGFISLEQAGVAAKEPLHVADFDPARESVAPYFIDFVNRQYGTARRSERTSDGDTETEAEFPGRPAAANPTVTTLDLDLQKIAGQAVQHQLDRLDAIYKPRGLSPQAALVAMDPKTGNVLAMVGGRDYGQSQLNRATDAERQPGSTFKPFVYAAALESGMSPLRKFTDAPQEFIYDHKLKYRPKNYGGSFSMRPVWMRDGLVNSLNVVTVDVAMQTGLARVANIAHSFGLPRPVPYPALALGTTEVTPLELAAAYAAFANGGRKIAPQVIAHSDRAEDPQVIQPATAYLITDMLRDVVDHGTAKAARGLLAGVAFAGKTGTSRDGWFVGYTPNLVCVVWIGFDDNKQLGLTGAAAALPIWSEFMKAALDLHPELGGKSFEQPAGVEIVEIDPDTNELATGKCPTHERVALLTAQVPLSECFKHNIYFDFGAESVGTVAVLTRTETTRLPKNRPQTSPGQFAQLRDTRIEIDKRGKKILVNDMRVGR